MPKVGFRPYETVPVVPKLVCHRITALLLLGDTLTVIPVIVTLEGLGVGVGLAEGVGEADGAGVGVGVGVE